MKHLEKIAQMVGQSYMYKKDVYAFTGFIPEEQTVRIKTNGKDIVLLYDDLPNCLNLFLEVEQEEGLTVAAQSMPEANSTMKDLRSILMDTITKVQADKDYVAQATQINKTATSLTNLLKAEMEFIKLTKAA